jgi:Tol biopolymer transport system component
LLYRSFTTSWLPCCLLCSSHNEGTVVLTMWACAEMMWQWTLMFHSFIVLGEVTWTKDGRSKNLTCTRNVPPKCNKQVTSKQQTRSFLTSIN